MQPPKRIKPYQQKPERRQAGAAERPARSHKTSWEKVSPWYNDIVGADGHYYHQKVIIPKLLPLLGIKGSPNEALLDLACGQGVLSRHLPEALSYTGVDISPTLIKAAKEMNSAPQRTFMVGDITGKLPLPLQHFSHATIILALQNVEHADAALKELAAHLKPGGKAVIVLNHPCFRIPRQSSWGVDEQNKLRYRRIDRYQQAMKIPIQAHPSQGKQSAQTWTFHHPLSAYTHWLKSAGLMVQQIEEWCSDRKSTGKASAMENRSRNEIPLFLTLVCIKEACNNS
jgi:ubiquinone/menaquinone biosynthesis C-methylase UbiE